MRLAFLPTLFALATVLAGCFQGEQVVVLYPDGSGTFTIKARLKKALVKWFEGVIAQSGGVAPNGQKIENPIDVLSDPARLMLKSEGILAWKTDAPVDEGEWVRITATGYFDDVSKVRVYEIDNQATPGERPKLTFSGALLRSGETSTLMITTHLPAKMEELDAKRPARQAPQDVEALAELMKPMMKDLLGAIRVTAPGPIREARGFPAVDGRTASFEFDGETLLAVVTNPDGDVAKRFRKMAVDGSSVTWTGDSVPAEELKAFKAQLEAARAQGLRNRAGAATAGAGLPDPSTLSDDEVDRLFIQAQVKNARELVKAARKDKAREILEGVIKEYPNQKATLEARKLLAELSK